MQMNVMCLFWYTYSIYIQYGVYIELFQINRTKKKKRM